MHATAVKPPATAAADPVATVSLCSCPGSRRCTCISISPGQTTRPIGASTTFTSPSMGRPRPTRAMRPPSIRTSNVPSRPFAGSTTRPPRSTHFDIYTFASANLAPLKPRPTSSAPLTARGESLAAFDGRCIPAGCVAPPSNTPGILGRRALPSGRLARLGATPDFHHGLPGELHLNRVVAKYGRHGGFCDLVNGVTPYLYPMTWGVSRSELHRLVTTHIDVRPEIQGEIDRIVAASFEPGAYIVGVHYRGTDSTHGLAGSLVDYRPYRIPYSAYADEVRRVLAVAAPRRCQVLVATDETEFLDFMRRELGDRVLCLEDAPRVRAGGAAIHFDDTLQVSNYQKGKSALVDCLLLAATSYLVKGRSNLSDASLAFSPRLPYSFCVR